jgi:hypothetical protein
MVSPTFSHSFFPIPAECHVDSAWMTAYPESILPFRVRKLARGRHRPDLGNVRSDHQSFLFHYTAFPAPNRIHQAATFRLTPPPAHSLEAGNMAAIEFLSPQPRLPVGMCRRDFFAALPAGLTRWDQLATKDAHDSQPPVPVKMWGVACDSLASLGCDDLRRRDAF